MVLIEYRHGQRASELCGHVCCLYRPDPGQLSQQRPFPVHFASVLAVLMMGDQRAISAFTKASNFAGVRSSLLGSDPPRSASRFFTPGSSSAWSSARASLSMTSFGVPFGAKIPAQMLIS